MSRRYFSTEIMTHKPIKPDQPDQQNPFNQQNSPDNNQQKLPDQQNSWLRFWNKHGKSFRQNTTLILATTVGGIIANSIGFSVNLAAFLDLLYPKKDNYKAGWVLVKIKGWSVTSYDQGEKMDGLGRFFPQRLQGTSQLTPMIYTDQKSNADTLNSGRSKEDDVSVLVNVDYEGEVPEQANKINKRNSQTFQARLIQAYSSQEPVCLFVYGIRNNPRSKFFNILEFREVSKDYVNQYNALTKREDATTDPQSQLANLARRACGSQTLYR